jgi:integrase
LAPLTRTFQSRQDAQTWARAQEHAIETGDLPVLKGARSLTLGDVLDRYEGEVIPLKRTDSTEGYMLNVMRRHPMCEKALGYLHAQDFADFRDTRLETAKPATVLRNLRVLKHALKIARNEWGLAAPVAELDKVRMPSVLVRHTDRVCDGQVAAMLHMAEAQSSHALALAVRLALATGLRRGELLALEWSDVDLHQGRLLVRMSKNGRPRMIPLTPDAIKTLGSLVPTDPRVIPISANALKLAFARTKRKARTSFRFHDLRHEAISRFFDIGLTIPEVQMIGGHRTLSQLSRYSHPDVTRVTGKLSASAPQNPAWPLSLRASGEIRAPKCAAPTSPHMPTESQ